MIPLGMDNNLVVLVDKEPRVSSLALEEAFGTNHKFVMELIRRHKPELEEYGIVPFETAKLKDGPGRPFNIALLNEHQSLLLLTYTRARKKTNALRHKLIKQFISMRNYIQKQEASRLAGIKARRSLTDEIRDSGENERMHGHGYATYTRLAYKLTGIPKGDRDKLSPEDLDRLENVELLMKGYLKAGQDYQQIKDALSPLFPSYSLKV